MSKITVCNHDPDFTICTECQKANHISELQATLFAADVAGQSMQNQRDSAVNALAAAEQKLKKIDELPDKWRKESDDFGIACGNPYDTFMDGFMCADELQAILKAEE